MFCLPHYHSASAVIAGLCVFGCVWFWLLRPTIRLRRSGNYAAAIICTAKALTGMMYIRRFWRALFPARVLA